MQLISNKNHGLIVGGTNPFYEYFFPSPPPEPSKDILEYIDKCQGPYSLTRRSNSDYSFNCFAQPSVPHIPTESDDNENYSDYSSQDSAKRKRRSNDRT